MGTRNRHRNVSYLPFYFYFNIMHKQQLDEMGGDSTMLEHNTSRVFLLHVHTAFVQLAYYSKGYSRLGQFLHRSFKEEPLGLAADFCMPHALPVIGQ